MALTAPLHGSAKNHDITSTHLRENSINECTGISRLNLWMIKSDLWDEIDHKSWREGGEFRNTALELIQLASMEVLKIDTQWGTMFNDNHHRPHSSISKFFPSTLKPP